MRRRNLLLLALVAAGGVVLAGGRVWALELQRVAGHVPAAVAGRAPVGQLVPERELHLAIGLPLRNSGELVSLLQRLYDPASPDYHQYLTPEQFATRFGPSEADYEAVVAFAEANGLTVTRHPNRVLVEVRGPVRAVQRAFHVTLQVYNHPREARTFYAPDAEPSLALAVPVLRISGLTDYWLPFPKHHKGSAANDPNAAPQGGSGPAGGYIGLDFRAAYVPGTSLTGAGQAVGLLEFDGYYASDVAAYLTLTGLPSVPLQNVLVGGFNGAPGPGNVEVTLDIDMCIAMAPGLSTIYVYEAPNSTASWQVILNRMATDNLARQLSCSWGGGPPDAVSEQIFQQMAAQGQSFFNAVGDSDAFVNGDIPFPAESTNIMQVGGTTLSTSGPQGSWLSEKVWNWGLQGTQYVGTCGGISTNYAIPSWQQGINMTANKGSTNMHNMPDVALTADNIFIIGDNGLNCPLGGTSAAAPLWAGFTALINQQAAQNKLAPVGFLNPALYAVGKGPQATYTTAFHDIVSGDNTWTNSPSLFFAVAGYDLCTGWGTPAGTNLINLLAPPVLSTLSLAVATNYVTGGNGNGIIDYNECNDLFIVLTNIGLVTATNAHVTLTTTNAAVFLPQPASAYGTIVIGGSSTNATPFKLSTGPGFVCGTPIALTLTIKTDMGTTLLPLQLATGTNVQSRYDTFLTTAIPDNDPSGTNSPMFVSGISGAIQKATVSLYATHTMDSDLTFQLISPDGTAVTLASQHGAGGQNYGYSCSPDNYRATFDDAATNSIGTALPPFVGTFQPDQPLAAFISKSGASANGVWQLHVIDNTNTGLSGILWCWSLNLVSGVCTDGGGQCPGVDLAIGMSDNPDPADITSPVVYTITVTNNGPGLAPNVVVADNLDPTVRLISAFASQGSVNTAGSIVTAMLGSLNFGATATITVTVQPLTPGTIYSTATVTSSESELNPANNSITISTTVNPATADLAVGLASAPNPTIVGGSLTYTVTVTNKGPAYATAVVVSNYFPDVNINVSGISYPQGTSVSAPGNNVLLFNVGPLAQNATAIAIVPVTPVSFGTIYATATARNTLPSPSDPYLLNNTVTIITGVGQAADLALGMSAKPADVVIGSNVTFVVSITNNGPNVATNVLVTQNLNPVQPMLTNYTSMPATITVNGGTLTCVFDNIPVNAVATITTVVQSTRLATLTGTASVAAAQADPVPGNNSASASATVDPAYVQFVLAGVSLVTNSSPNGWLSPGDTATVQFRLENRGNVPNTNLVASLQASGGIIPSSPTSQAYGILKPTGIPGGLPVSRPFTFTVSPTAVGSVVATLALLDAGSNYPPVSNTFVLPTIIVSNNPAVILIPDSGRATNYPSIIAMPDVPGQVGKVTATISNINHSFIQDVNVLLVSPGGAETELMSHAGNWSYATNVTLTFDDSAADSLPSDGQIDSGTYKPTAYGDVTFPSPAPPGPYSQYMSDFNGLSARGNWSLYVYDDSPGDNGAISNGWSLALTSVLPVNPSADVGVSVLSTPASVLVGANLTNVFIITNGGPATATGVTFSNVLPVTASFVSAGVSQGNWITTNGALVGNLSSLPVGGAIWVTNVLQPLLSVIAPGRTNGVLTNLVFIAPFESDLHTNNNHLTATNNVLLPQIDLALSVAGPTDPVIAGSNLTFTITVTNAATNMAFSVVVTNVLPPGVTFRSSVPPSIPSGNVVTFALGDLAAGAGARLTLTVAPGADGSITNTVLLTNTATVTTASIDIAGANNSAAFVVTVTPPAPKIVPAGAVLTFESLIRNGAVDPGETNTVSLSLANVGVVGTTNLAATLLAANNVIPLGNATANYGALAPGGTAVARSFTFCNNALAGGSVVATLQQSDVVRSQGTVSFPFSLSQPVSSTTIGGITIPDHGSGSPYPSVVSISGMTGVVSKATVTLSNLVHSFPRDISVLLVGPTGQNVLLMAHAGGGYRLTNGVNLTFDDSAASALPADAAIASGTYQPTAYTSGYGGMPSFPASTPYGSRVAVFTGSSPNGNWLLYVRDDVVGDSGSIANWTLNLTVVNPVSPLADLATAVSSSPASPYADNTLTYTITVTNLGPSTGTNVVLTDVLPQGLDYAGAYAPGASSYGVAGQTFTASYSSLAANSAAVVSLYTKPRLGGTLVNSPVVTSAATDLIPANNSATNSTFVSVPNPASLAAKVVGNALRLTLTGQAGMTYQIQAVNNSLTTNWTTITNVVVPLAQTTNFTDASFPGYQTRFYRAVRVTQ